MSAQNPMRCRTSSAIIALRAASCSKVAPSAVPEPAVVSRHTMRAARHLPERLRVAGSVARQSGLRIVHEVAGVRHHERDAEPLAALQLRDERRDAARPERRIGRSQVDEVRVVRDHGAKPAVLQFRPERSTTSSSSAGSFHWLGVLVNTWIAVAPMSTPRCGVVGRPPCALTCAPSISRLAPVPCVGIPTASSATPSDPARSGSRPGSRSAGAGRSRSSRRPPCR